MAQILVIGSIAADEVVQLDQPLRYASHNGGRWLGVRMGGGAANTALALARATHDAMVVSALGQDDIGQQLYEALIREGVNCRYVNRDAEETTRSLILLEQQGERTIINLARAEVPLADEVVQQSASVLYVRSKDSSLNPLIADKMAQGCKVIGHIPPTQPQARLANVLVGSASDLSDEFLAQAFHYSQAIAGEQLEWLVITYGEQGAKAINGEQELFCPAPKVPVMDSTGAGDVFAAGLCHALATNEPMAQALQTAVAWGSTSVQYQGTIPPKDFSNLTQNYNSNY